ncbi:nuclear transport factor 2 family protein [Vannielia sp. SX4]|uniref:nuclear transport factor 2 family protein n=1 Tax=Vannielia sp. SX4 TaxID=3463852 RepID=UPI0040593126
MNKHLDAEIDTELTAAIESYCRALHAGDGGVLDMLCDDRFLMHWLGADGQTNALDKAGFVARVGGRDAFPGAPDFRILRLSSASEDMAQVKVDVRVPPRVFCDELGFLRTAQGWRLITKLFRVADGPAMEAKA